MRPSLAIAVAVLWVVLHCGWWCQTVVAHTKTPPSSSPSSPSSPFSPPLAGQVLVLSPPFRGHVTPLVRLSRELLRRGNNVTFVTYSPATSWVQTGAPGVRVVQLPLPISKEYLREARLAATRDPSPAGSALVMLQQVYLSFYSSMHPGLLHVLSSGYPDVIVADVTAVAAVDVGHQLNVPVVLNSPSLMFAGKGNPAWAPPLASGHQTDFSLWGRLQRFVYPQLMSVSSVSLTLVLNQHRQGLGLQALGLPLDQLLASTRILVNTAVGFDHPRPTSPLHLYTGPLLPDPVALSATGVAAEWLAGSNPAANGPGGVYVRLGSMAVLPKSFMSTLIRALTASGLRVIWGMEPKEQLRLRSKLKATQAFTVANPAELSHFALLESDAVSVVLSTCGMGLVMEALYFGKSLLCLPHVGDQFDVAARVVDAGAGVSVSWTGLTSKSLEVALASVVSDVGVRLAATRQRQLLRATGGLDYAVHVVESDMRFGSRHLVPLDVKVPWHRALCTDVIALAVACLCLVVSGARGLMVWWFGGVPSTSVGGVDRKDAVDGSSRPVVATSPTSSVGGHHEDYPKKAGLASTSALSQGVAVTSCASNRIPSPNNGSPSSTDVPNAPSLVPKHKSE